MTSNAFLLEYLPVLLFIGVTVAVAFVTIAGIRVLKKQSADPDKLSSEAGTVAEISDDTHNMFDVRFYFVCLLFIVFTLIIAFLFPWAISLGEIGLFGFWSMILFLAVLSISFIYTWKEGVLDWE